MNIDHLQEMSDRELKELVATHNCNPEEGCFICTEMAVRFDDEDYARGDALVESEQI